MDSRPSLTAEAVCFMRAVDQHTPPADRVIDDLWARYFLSPGSMALLISPAVAWSILPELNTYVRARHRYMDDRAREALSSSRPGGPVEQLVILGAGYDMRGVRLAAELAGRPVFEVDYPSTAQRKQRILSRIPGMPDRAHIRYVTIDFQTQSLGEVLLPAGFDPKKPTFFTWEGVSMYLSRDAVHGTLGALRDLAAPGSGLTMDYFCYLDTHDRVASIRRFSAALLAIIAEPVTFPSHPEDVAAFMERDGWAVTDVADAAELERRYIRDGRPCYPANFVVSAAVAAR
ncbi:MAG: SAM-dependent methyltransferase [Myxococcales bacterium]|nr:SAM-dependent methyltransferase [Myxococcales bacterium]